MSHATADAFHILLIGDFGGRSDQGVMDPDTSLSAHPRAIDCDNFDQVLKRFDARLHQILVSGNDEPVTISFQELDHLHPDYLFEQVPLFESLRGLRRRLQNPSTFQAAAEEVFRWNSYRASSEPAAEPASDATTQESLDPSNLLAQMLDQASSIDSGRSSIDFQHIIRQIVAPYMPQSIDPRQDELVRCVDSATEMLMTALLHHPHFQQLESAWRGLDFLIRRIEADVDLKIFVLNVAPEEVAADLLDAAGNPIPLEHTRLYQTLVERTVRTPGGIPWSLVGWLPAVSPTRHHLALLQQLAKLCRLGQTRLAAGVSGKFVGCHKPSQTPAPEDWSTLDADWLARWNAWRSEPEARSLALFWPRFLLRLPYGVKTNPIEAFAFEELPAGQSHDQLLWGSPVLLVAAAVASAYRRDGWDMHWSRGCTIGELPWLTTRVDGEAVAHPCGELLLTERGAEKIGRLGIVPVLSFPNRDSVQLPIVESVAGMGWSD